MEYWEFLIQKEGDRAWLPLESPDVEILEGRYRIVARSSRPNTDVEIRLTHQSIEEGAKKQRVQKRHHRTNKDGLMVVFPFTRLVPGHWELSCSGDLMSDLLGNTWRHTVQLLVLPVDSDVDSDWDEENTPPQAEEASSAATEPQAEEVPTSTSAAVLLPLSLTLERENYIAVQGESITIAGEVKLLSEPEIVELNVRPYELQICLIDPQNAQVLKEIRHSLPLAPLPLTFEHSVELPSDCPIRLMLGEVRLIEAGSTIDDSSPVLASEGFTIAVGVNELIETIAQQRQQKATSFSDLDLDSDPGFDLESDRNSDLDEVNLYFFEVVNQPKTNHTIDFKPSSNQPLPPQLYQPRPEKTEPKSPQLPAFLRPPAPEPEISEPLEEIPEAEAIETPEVREPTTESLLSINADTPDFSPTAPEFEIINPDLEGNGLSSQYSSLSDRAFRTLRLQDRFAAKLSAFSKEAESTEEEEETPDLNPELESVAEVEQTSSDEATAPQLSAEHSNRLAAPEADLEAQEVVVDLESEADRADVLESSEPSPDVDRTPTEATREETAEEIASALLAYRRILPDEEPVPMPRLQVPAGDLVAGETITIGVKLPQVESRLYVKLWLQDRQTRSLLDGPRWLVEFAPNLLGSVETTTELTIPYGCMEIQIEAIAAEVETQRESHKVSISRSIVPPDLPELVLDEFDLS